MWLGDFREGFKVLTSPRIYIKALFISFHIVKRFKVCKVQDVIVCELGQNCQQILA